MSVKLCPNVKLLHMLHMYGSAQEKVVLIVYNTKVSVKCACQIILSSWIRF